MRYPYTITILLILLLSACTAGTALPSAAATPMVSATLSAMVSATFSSIEKEVPATPPPPTLSHTASEAVDQPPAGQDLSRTDEQGAVVVEVTPRNLANPGDTLDFVIEMNTHSVDLGMDLAQFATLKTDTGLTTSATAWDGMAGGHHVSGNLSFPAQVDGKTLLDGAKVLTLVIQNVDAPERTFTWDLTP